MAGKSLIGALRVTLGLDSANFSQGVARTRKEMTTMQKGAAALKGALVGVIGIETLNQFRQLGRAALDSVGALGEQAQQIGVNTDVLQQYRYMASQVGIANDEMDKGLQQLVRRIGDAATGNKAQLAAFDRLGVSIFDASGKARDGDAVFRDVADAISKLPTAAEQAAAAADVFGARLGQKMLPALAEGSKAIDDYVRKARDLGIVISAEAIKNADAVADQLAENDRVLEMRKNAMFAENAQAVASVEMMWQNAQIGLYKGVAAVGEFFAAWTEGAAVAQGQIDQFDAAAWAAIENLNSRLIAWGETTKQIFAALAVAAISGKDRMVAAFIDLSGQAAQWLGQMVGAIKAEVLDRLNAVWRAATDRIDAVKRKFFDLYDAVVGNSYIPDMVDEIGQHMKRLQTEMVDPAAKAAAKTAGVFENLQRDLADESGIQRVRVVESWADMTDGVLREVDRLVKGIRSGNAIDIVGGLLNAVDGIARIFNGGAGIGGLFGAGSGAVAAGAAKIGNIPKMAKGGAFRVGGIGGTDRNLLAINGQPRAWVSANENVAVSPPGAIGNGSAPVLQFDLRGAVMTQDLVQQMNAIGRQAALQGARGGAQLAMGKIARRQAKALG